MDGNIIALIGIVRCAVNIKITIRHFCKAYGNIFDDNTDVFCHLTDTVCQLAQFIVAGI